MPRLMSITLTEQAVVERRKTVTRRLGWKTLTPGTRLTLCRKVMGRRHRCDHPSAPGLGIRGCPLCDANGYVVDPLVRLAEVEVVSVRREPLRAITVDDVAAEAVDPGRFEHIDPRTGQPWTSEWVRWFCAEQGVTPDTTVTRIEWRYLDEAAASS